MAKSKEPTGKSLKGKQAIGKSLKGKEVIGKSSSVKRKSVSKPDGSGNARGGEKKRPRGLKFVDDVAMDADYDEEEELDSDEESDDNDFVDDLAEEMGGTNKTAKMNVLPFLVKEEGQDLENFIKERYSHVVYADDSQDVKGFDDRMSTMHSMKDPIIWKVRCTAGREQQLAVCLMQKFIELQNLNTRLQIISAFAIDHLKGCIFVEAEKESHVIEACKGYCYVYTSRISLVPHSEVPHLLSVEHKPCGLSEGMWVRIKNGNYKGDLGQVVAVEENWKRAMIKLIPRIDLQALAKKFGGGMSLKQTPVPAPRLIRPVELEDFRPHIERKRDRLTGEVFDELDGLMLKEGFFYKKVSLGSLSYLDIQPSADEEERFKMKTSIPDDLDWLSELYEGHGKVYSAHLAEKKNRVSETRNECSYLLNDFVLFGQKDFGLIVGVDGEAFKIIKGAVEATEVVTVMLQEIKKKMCDKMFTAPDSNRTTVTIGDTLRVVGGPFEGREGILRHLYKGTVFIQDNSNLENNGYFCTKSELCEKINLKGTCKGMEVQQSSAFHNAGSSNYQPESSGNRGHCRSFRSNYQGEGDRFSIGQALRIRVGPLKGHLCRVVALHRYDLTVKLLSQAKVIKVSHDHVSESKNLSENSFGQVTNGGFKDDSDKGFGSPKETTGWDSELPSSGRDLCNLSPSSLFASDFSKTLDTILSSDVLKTDQGHEAWVKKTNHMDHLGDITDGWSKVVEKATVGSIADPWERKSNQTGESDEATGGWEKPRPCSGADLWGSKSNQTDEPHKATGGWGNADVGSRAAVGSSADCWLSKSNQAGEYDKATDGWGKKTAVGSNDDHWASKSNDAGDFDKATDDWGKKAAVGSIGDHWARKSSDAGDSDKATDDQKHAAVGSSADLWASKLNQSEESDKAIDGWEKAAVESRGVRSNQAVESNKPTDSWAKAALGSSADPWNSKSNRSEIRDGPFDGWENASGGSNQAVESDRATNGWEKAAGDSRANPVEVKSNQTSISKDSAGGWEKAGLASMADPLETKWNPAGESAKATDGHKNSALGPSDNPWERQSSQDRESNEAADGWQRAAKQPSCDPMEETEKRADLSVKAPGWDNPWGKSADQVSYSSKSIDGADNPLTRDKPDSWNKAVDNNDFKRSWHDSIQENVWTKSTTGYCAGGWKGAGQFGGWGDAAKDVVRQEQNQNDTNKWNRSNSFGGQQGLGWNKASEGAQGSGFSRRGTEDDRDGWGGQSGGWSKMRAFEGGRGSGGRRGRGERGGRGGRGVEQGQGERGRGGWGGRGGARGGRGDYSGRGRDFSNHGRFSGQDHSGQNQNQESNFSGVDGNSGGGWNDYKGDGGQAGSWNKGTYFKGGKSELSEYGGSKELDGSSWGKARCEGQPSSNWNKKAFDEESNGCETSTGWKRGQDIFERDPNSSWQKTNYFGGEDLVDQGGRGDSGWRGGRRGGGRGGGRGGDRGGGRGGRGFGRGRGRGFSGEHSSSGWNNSDEGSFGGNESSGWNKGDRERFGGNRSSGWNKGDKEGFGGNGSSGWNKGDRGGFGGKGSSGWNNGDGGGFGGNGSGWSKGDRGGFGGNGSSGWNNGDGSSGGNGSSGWNNGDGGSGGNGSGWSNGDRGGFGGNGSGCKRGDEGGFGGQGSSGWNKGDGGGFGGNRSLGWNNGNGGGLGGKGSSGWKNGDDGGLGGKGSSGWNKGGGVVCGGATPAWNNGEGGNEGGVKEGEKDPWEKFAGSWGKTSEPSEKGGW